MGERLTTQEYWTGENPSFEFQKHSNHAISDLIRKYIPPANGGNCIEIGSFPGPFLTVFGDLGYELNGIDFHSKNARELPDWLTSIGYKTAEFKTIDFFDYKSSRKFDVVASFGFIEHFQNFEDVTQRHGDLVKDDGYIVITTPNFRGWIQKWLHKTFDKRNLAIHNLDSMYPDEWAKVLKRQGFEVKYCGYFGGFQFWRDKEPMSGIKKPGIWVIERMIARLRKILWFESAAFSAYCGIVARKKIK